MFIWSSGPVFVYTASRGQILYLGVTEAGPDINNQVAIEPVRSDIAGSIRPRDKMYMGEFGTLSLTFTEWKQSSMYHLERLMNDVQKIPGADRATDRGQLYVNGNFSYPIYFLHGHRNDPIMVAQGMPRGRVYLSCIPTDFRPIRGRKANKMAVTLEWESTYNNLTGIFLGWSETAASLQPVENAPAS